MTEWEGRAGQTHDPLPGVFAHPVVASTVLGPLVETGVVAGDIVPVGQRLRRGVPARFEAGEVVFRPGRPAVLRPERLVLLFTRQSRG